METPAQAAREDSPKGMPQLKEETDEPAWLHIYPLLELGCSASLRMPIIVSTVFPEQTVKTVGEGEGAAAHRDSSRC